MAVRTSGIRVGVSGWRYPSWRGVFYPRGWPQARELAYVAQHLNSVEINGSFYSLQHPDSYGRWYESTPDDFLFAVKGGRFITHMKRLAAVEAPLANFFASGVLRLAGKLGPILWQLPPSLPFEADRLAAFFRRLPRDTRAAAQLARRHDRRVAGRAFTHPVDDHPIRHALEVRHPSYEDPQFVDLLRQNGIGLVVADTAGVWPLLEDVTADFVYIRLHGDAELYVSGYTGRALDGWAGKIRSWAGGQMPARSRLMARPAPPAESGRDVFVYFDNDAKVHAPFDAIRLANRLGLGEPLQRPAGRRLVAAAARPRWPGYGRSPEQPLRRPARGGPRVRRGRASSR
jgi:uncharacterized protein YecE (DUF72 family)